MSISRRNILKSLALGIPLQLSPAFAISNSENPAEIPFADNIENGPFEGTRASLRAYEIPEWYRDAKFGIWSHWGPQSAVEAGDWYARNMYMQGNRQYDYHVKTYGHPSKFGFKDTIPAWKAEKFFMGWPQTGLVVIKPLSAASEQKTGSIENVELLGYGKVQFARDGEGLTVTLPSQKPCEYAYTLKISGQNLI